MESSGKHVTEWLCAKQLGHISDRLHVFVLQRVHTAIFFSAHASCSRTVFTLCLLSCSLKLQLVLICHFGVQVELLSEAVATKAFDAGWQKLSTDAVPEPDANQLFVLPG